MKYLASLTPNRNWSYVCRLCPCAVTPRTWSSQRSLSLLTMASSPPSSASFSHLPELAILVHLKRIWSLDQRRGARVAPVLKSGEACRKVIENLQLNAHLTAFEVV
eukprot:6211021-Pleurochrysis_carterae.AAC.1